MAEFDFELIPVPHNKHRTDAETAFIEPGGIGVELGVMRGNHAQQLLETANPSKLYLVDPWEGQDARYENVVDKFKDDPRVVILRTTAEKAMNTIEDKFDWIVHDTAQYWPSSYTDLGLCDNRLNVGGLLFFDYCYKDRKVCFEKFMKDTKNYHVVTIIEDTDTVVVKKTDIQVSWKHRTSMKKCLCTEGSVGAEIGVLGGNHASEILELVKPSKLTLIDVWDGNKINYMAIGSTVGRLKDLAKDLTKEEVGGQLYQYVIDRFKDKKDQVRIIRGLSTVAADCVDDDSLDWVYIDAAHDYDNVIADLEAYYSKVKAGGLIMGHDYSYRVKVGGVIKAVTEFLENHGDVEFVGLSGERAAPSFALRKKNA